MKFSLLIAAMILGVSAILAVSRENRIKTLTTEWDELVTKAESLSIPIDPKESFSPDRARAQHERLARKERVDDFADELIAFFHKMKTAEKNGEDNESRFSKEIAEIIGTMVEFDSDELRMLVQAISEDTSVQKEHKRDLISFATMMLGSDNPEAALAIALEVRESFGTDDRKGDRIMESVLKQYAAKDPLAAGQWLADHGEEIGEVQRHVKQGMVAAAAQKDIGLALELITTLKLNEAPHAFNGIAGTVTRDNADAFISALRDNTSPEQLKSAFSSLSQSPLMRDYDSATAWIESDKITDEERRLLISTINYEGIKEEPEKWLNWIDTQQEQGNSLSGNTANIISQWTNEDFAATGEWINSQPAGPRKDEAIFSYAQSLHRHEPAAAADWATTLPPGNKRSELLKSIHRSYKKKDPEAAAALAKKHGLNVE